jgi:spermidine/putrescine transport system substrate-binding protein
VNPTEFRRYLTAGNLDRRRFNKLLASVGIVSGASALFGRALHAEQKLQVFTWANYNLPEQFTEYTAKYGGPPDFSLFTENDEGRAKLRGGFTPDIVVPTEGYVPFFLKDKLLAPIDVSRLKHWPELFEKMRNVEATMGPNGEHYHLPWTWGTNGVVFRTDLAPEYVGNPTWKILWDPKYKGKIALRDAPNATIVPAALIQGFKNPYSLTDDELEKVGEMLRQQRELVRFYWKTESEVQQALASGEIVAAYGWNTTYAQLKNNGVPAAYMVPKEGMPIWVDGYSLVKGGGASEDQKYDFLDAVLSPETGAFNIKKLNYGVTNSKSYELVDKKTLESLGLDDVETILDNALWAKAVPQDILRKMVDLHNRVKSGF